VRRCSVFGSSRPILLDRAGWLARLGSNPSQGSRHDVHSDADEGTKPQLNGDCRPRVRMDRRCPPSLHECRWYGSLGHVVRPSCHRLFFSCSPLPRLTVLLQAGSCCRGVGCLRPVFGFRTEGLRAITSAALESGRSQHCSRCKSADCDRGEPYACRRRGAATGRTCEARRCYGQL
jgi:hypothetical protein